MARKPKQDECELQESCAAASLRRNIGPPFVSFSQACAGVIGCAEGEAFGDPRESPEVGEAQLYRLPLHLESCVRIDFRVTGPDLVAGAAELADPVGNEMPCSVLGSDKLPGQLSSTTAAASTGPLFRRVNFFRR